jgi:hypothetical protein
MSGEFEKESPVSQVQVRCRRGLGLPSRTFERSARFYEKVLGGCILTTGNNEGVSEFIEIARRDFIDSKKGN